MMRLFVYSNHSQSTIDQAVEMTSIEFSKYRYLGIPKYRSFDISSS